MNFDQNILDFLEWQLYKIPWKFLWTYERWKIRIVAPMQVGQFLQLIQKKITKFALKGY